MAICVWANLYGGIASSIVLHTCIKQSRNTPRATQNSGPRYIFDRMLHSSRKCLMLSTKARSTQLSETTALQDKSLLRYIMRTRKPLSNQAMRYRSFAGVPFDQTSVNGCRRPWHWCVTIWEVHNIRCDSRAADTFWCYFCPWLKAVRWCLATVRTLLHRIQLGPPNNVLMPETAP